MQLHVRPAWGKVVLICLAGLLMAAGIHLTQEFRFYNIESSDLFLYDWADVWDKMQNPGGLAALMASFLTQFMRIPFAGTLIVSGVYVLTVWILCRILDKVSQSNVMYGFSFLPAAFLFLCMENDYYRFQGHMAFVLMLSALYAYLSVPEGKWRYVVGIIMVPVLYHAAGSISLVFSVSAMIWEITGESFRGLKGMTYPAVFALMAFVYVRFSFLNTWEHALTPFMYYDWPSTYFFPTYAWVTVPALILVAWISAKMNVRTSLSGILLLAGMVLSFFVAGNLYTKVHSKSYYRLIQEQYWAENEDWDRIIKTADRSRPTFLISYLNLALAQKGLLVRNFMYYNPQDLSSVMYPTPNLKTGLTLQSTVYQAWDYYAAARQAAFDANVVTPGNRNPRQLQTLVRTNAVLGAYDVAEKYLSLLEKTLFYRDEAQELRNLMDSQTAGVLPQTDGYLRYDGLKGDMRDILEVCPDHRILSQFYQLYQILEQEGQR